MSNIYHDDKSSHHAVIIVNLGSPNTASYFDIMRFLREFLSDNRVIKLPKAIWLPILYGFILPFRSRKLVKSYQEILVDGKIPLHLYSENLAHKMNELTNEHTHVRLALRYGSPSISDAIESLRKYPIKKLTILPLFAQYSASTSASTFDALATWARKQNFLWDTKFIHSYHDHPAYLTAICESIKAHWAKNGQKHLLFTYHGLPKAMLLAGDPYHCYCVKTTRLLCEMLNLKDDEHSMSFQSRFGAQEWLKPYTDDVIPELAKKHEAIDVICPGFAVDCLETIEEVNMGYRELFLENGGKDFHMIPCLNDQESHAKALLDVISSPF